MMYDPFERWKAALDSRYWYYKYKSTETELPSYMREQKKETEMPEFTKQRALSLTNDEWKLVLKGLEAIEFSNDDRGYHYEEVQNLRIWISETLKREGFDVTQ